MKKSKPLILGILGLFVTMILILFLSLEERDEVPELESVVSEFDYVKSFDIYGTSPSLFLSFEIDKTSTVEEVDKVFIRVRDILFNNESFTNLMHIHKERYGGTVIRLHVIFTCGVNPNKAYYDYCTVRNNDGVSSINSFSHWKVDRNGEEQDFNK